LAIKQKFLKLINSYDFQLSLKIYIFNKSRACLISLSLSKKRENQKL